MKKIFFLGALALAPLFVASCDDDNDNAPRRTVVDFESEAFACLVDSPQYGGPLIYSAAAYEWRDALTSLSGRVEKDDWTAFGAGYGWKSGFAISDYVDTSAVCTFDRQLAVPAPNGSRRWAVCYGDTSSVSFADGRARRLVSFDYCPTTYLLRDMQRASQAQSGYRFTAVVVLTPADGKAPTRLELPLAVGTQIPTGWTRLTLPTPQEAVGLSVSFTGTDSGAWGLNTPKYLALDNITVEE